MGVPPRLRTLSDLQLVGPQSKASPEEKTRVLLVWLARERRQPTETLTGKGGFPITSGYLQAQMLQALSAAADPLLLRDLAGSKQVRDAGARDAARLALGLMRDPEQVPELIRILRKSPEPYFRWRAAQALAGLGAKEARPALRQACLDPYAVTSQGGARSKKGDVVHPVRNFAAAALAALDDPKTPAQTTAGRRQFARRLEESRRRWAAGKVKLSLSEAVGLLNQP